MTGIRGIVFDKDGTLFDFQATWGAWAKGLITEECAGDPDRMARVARAMGYDVAQGAFLPDSIVIAHTSRETAEVLLPHFPDDDLTSLLARMDARAATAPQVEVVPLAGFLNGLSARGLRLGVMTNDSEAPARAHLRGAGVEHVFDRIIGSDSGHGAKPDPAPLLAFCSAVGLEPQRCAMVGDSLHDLRAGRAAGMVCVAVLTGVATQEDLAPHADVVLTSIAELPGWLDG